MARMVILSLAGFAWSTSPHQTMGLIVMLLTHPTHDSLLKTFGKGAYLFLGTVRNASSPLNSHLATTFGITSFPGWAVRATQSLGFDILFTSWIATHLTLSTMTYA